MALLKWASRTGAFVIEDDYDSEYRFEGRPVPARLEVSSTPLPPQEKQRSEAGEKEFPAAE